MTDAPGYFFHYVSLLFLEVDQIEKLRFIDLIMMNRMQKLHRSIFNNE
jgi:hypothetical protein